MLEGFVLLEKQDDFTLWLGKQALYRIEKDDAGWNVNYIYGLPRKSEIKHFDSEDEALVDIYSVDATLRRKWRQGETSSDS